ncbi:hypothetical protein ZYGR_0U02690 [Zygosaccharomyces rouxii]|uniref:Tyrosine--tRNA ligase n=1 Tax=Zygosaccharomyces rouxii TaxID=4956 RepID=A0A1Q3A456_ZYGRO|nr:hypothetical protein ZYGR_0U02690 [Zygosaccharomyces rouxii]
MFKYASRRLLSSTAKSPPGLLEDLKLRGLIAQVAQPEQWLHEKLSQGHKIKLYCGADPTAKSLHLGNVVPLMILLNFYVKGHDVFALVGGATGRVGDPSGRTTERQGMSDDSRLDNVDRIQQQFTRFFENGWKYYESRFPQISARGPGRLVKVDNYHWWKDIKLLDFLAQYGRHIRVQSMFSRSSIASRIEGKDGLGFNEFTYQVLQAYDFYHLYKTHGVSLQVGGNDQWGNITAGIDFIDRVVSSGSDKLSPGGITAPLLSTSTGEKFGKSAGNAIFLDPQINTAYDIFQFFYNTKDADVCRFLKIFTLLPLETIGTVVQDHMEQPHLRKGQRFLAKEVTDLLFGVGSGERSSKVSEVLFGHVSEANMSADELIKLFSEAKILQKVPRGQSLVDIITQVAPCSKSEARRKLSQGSVLLHSSKLKVTENIDQLGQFLIDDKVLILRIGKQKCHVIEIL